MCPQPCIRACADDAPTETTLHNARCPPPPPRLFWTLKLMPFRLPAALRSVPQSQSQPLSNKHDPPARPHQIPG